MNLRTTVIKTIACGAMAAISAALVTGCAISKVDSRPQSTSTAVALNEKNYRMIKAGAVGRSHGFRLLGVLPFASPNAATARESLYASVKEPLNGRAVALANQMEDRTTLYLILFSVPKLTITGDVIEFTDKNEK